MNPFGVLAFLHWNHDWNNFHFPPDLRQAAIKQIRDLGVGFIRLDILWSDVTAGYKKYDFSRYDDLISSVRDNGLDILALLHYNKAHKDTTGEIWNQPPHSFEEFATYVGDTVRHFKGKISHWEIWNEPNHPFYWAAPPDNLRKYCELLRLSYQAAKGANPDAIVLNGGLTHPLVDSVKNLYANGAKNYFDRLSIHPFMDPKSTTAESDFHQLIRDIEGVMNANADAHKKIWITEMGCPGMPDEHRLKWFQGEGLTEQEQSEWLNKQFHWVKAHSSIEKIFWAFYRDTGNLFKEGADYLGLVRFDMSPKPAYHAFQDLIHQPR